MLTNMKGKFEKQTTQNNIELLILLFCFLHSDSLNSSVWSVNIEKFKKLKEVWNDNLAR